MKKRNRRKYKTYTFRMILLISVFAVQAALVVIFLTAFNRSFPYFWVFSFILSAAAAFFIVNQEMNPDVKLALVIPIMLFPVLGGYMYLLLSRRRPIRGLPEQKARMDSALAPLAEENINVLRKIGELNETAAMQFRYLCLTNNFPVYENTVAEYLSPGERFFKSLKEKLRSAEKSIFMEYFILHEGSMWNEILGILAEKARAGLDVRLIYDDMGCLRLLPDKYDEQIRALGIRCRVYNHLEPLLSSAINMRDHRKITVVDGRIAFTGGINLADEYINKNRKLRYWKDASIMLEGDAAQSFTCMFQSLWDSLEPAKQETDKAPEKPVAGGAVPDGVSASGANQGGSVPDGVSTSGADQGGAVADGISASGADQGGAVQGGTDSGGAVPNSPLPDATFANGAAADGPLPDVTFANGTFPGAVSPAVSYAAEFGRIGVSADTSPGFVAPYADVPADREPVGENVYLNLIAGAREYIHICTPYFIPDAETLAMLFLAAKNGIDVKIVTPFTPDNWNIHLITRTFYRQLIENGIKVYEYTPGFMHSKTLVCDHALGVVGSINFDFRSLFFHHECAVLMYRTSAIEYMDKDFEEILKASRGITLEECLNGKASVKIAGSFLRLFAPLF